MELELSILSTSLLRTSAWSNLIIPVFAQVFLTFVLMGVMAVKRVQAAQAQRYKLRDIAVNNRNYPDDIAKYGNSYSNQFEQPVLFYLLCVLLLISGQRESGLFAALAFLYVALRYVHAFIHITSNNVIRRFYAFLAASAVLVSMWVLFAVSVFM